MDDLIKRRIAGALALVGIALAVATLLPRPGKAPAEPGVKHVTIDLAAPVAMTPSPAPPADDVLPQAVAAAPARAPEPAGADTPDAAVEVSDGSSSDPQAAAAPPADTAFPAPEPSAAMPEPGSRSTVTPVASAPPTQAPAASAPPRSDVATAAPAPAAATKPAPAPAKPIAKPPDAPVANPALTLKPALALSRSAASPPPAVAATAVAPKPSVGGWMIQVGSFADIGNAHLAQDKLKEKGYASIISPADTAKGTLYRVRAGPFTSKEQALTAKPVVVALGFAQASVVDK